MMDLVQSLDNGEQRIPIVDLFIDTESLLKYILKEI